MVVYVPHALKQGTYRISIINLLTKIYTSMHIACLFNRSVRLSSPFVIPHFPTPYVLQAWWTSIGTEAAWGCPPDGRRLPPSRGMRPSWPGFLASPGRRPFLPGPLSPPYPTSRSPAMVRTGRKGFIPTNQTNQSFDLKGLRSA